MCMSPEKRLIICSSTIDSRLHSVMFVFVHLHRDQPDHELQLIDALIITQLLCFLCSHVLPLSTSSRSFRCSYYVVDKMELIDNLPNLIQ